jgi:HK97 family phage prohead protease
MKTSVCGSTRRTSTATTRPRQRLAQRCAASDLDQMSFAFVDRTPYEQRVDDNGLRNIRDVQLFDVSVVTFPWYEDTNAELNSLDEAFTCIRNGSHHSPKSNATCS